MAKDQLEKINVSDHMKSNALPAYKISNDDINNTEDKSINISSDTKKLQDDIKHLLISYNTLYKSTADNRSLRFAQILYEKHVELFTSIRTLLLLDNVNIEENLYKLIDESLSNLILDNEIHLNESKKNITDKILDLVKKYSNLNISSNVNTNQAILKDDKHVDTINEIDRNASNNLLSKHNLTKLYNKINISINNIDTHISKKLLNISKLINNNHFNRQDNISNDIIKTPVKNKTYNKIKNKNINKENKNNAVQIPLLNNKLLSQKDKKRSSSQKHLINISDSKKEITISLSKKHSAFKLLLNIGSFFKDIKSILNVFKIIVSAIKKIFNISVGAGVGLIKKTVKVISDKTKKILSASAKLLKTLIKGALVAFFMSPMGAKTIGWIFGKITKLVKKVSEYAADLFKDIKKVFSKVIRIANKVFDSVIGFFKKPDDTNSNSSSDNSEKSPEDINGLVSSFIDKINNIPNIFNKANKLINDELIGYIKQLDNWSNTIIIGLRTAYFFYSGFSKIGGLQSDLNAGWIAGGFGGLFKSMFDFTFSNTLQDVLDTFVPAKPKKQKLTIKEAYINWYPRSKETEEDKQKNRARTGQNLQGVKNINSNAILHFDEQYDLLFNRDSVLDYQERATYKSGSLAHLYSLMSGKTLEGDKDVKTPVDDNFTWNVKGGMFGTEYVLDIFYNNVLNLSKTDVDDIIDIENKKSLSIDSQYEFIKRFIINQKMINDFIMYTANSSNEANKAVLNEFFLPENNAHRYKVFKYMTIENPEQFDKQFINFLYKPNGIELLLAKDYTDDVSKKNNLRKIKTGGFLKILFSDFKALPSGDLSVLMSMKFNDKTILSNKLDIVMRKKPKEVPGRPGVFRQVDRLDFSDQSINIIAQYNDILNNIFGCTGHIISPSNIHENMIAYSIQLHTPKNGNRKQRIRRAQNKFSSPADLYKNININGLSINARMLGESGMKDPVFINKISNYGPDKYANLFDIDIQELQKHIQDYDTDAILDMIKEKEISEDIIKNNSANDNANSEYLLYAMTQILNAAKTQ